MAIHGAMNTPRIQHFENTRFSSFRDECVLKVGVLGINFKIASLEVREAIARAAEILSGEMGMFFSHPIVLLSTCNRTEIYFAGNELASINTAKRSLWIEASSLPAK